MLMIIYDKEEFFKPPKTSGFPQRPRLPFMPLQYCDYAIEVDRTAGKYSVVKNRLNGRTGQFWYGGGDPHGLTKYVNYLLITTLQLQHSAHGMQAPHPDDIDECNE